MNLLGIDIGGTKISVSVGDEKGNILSSRRMPTHVAEGPESGIQRTVEMIRAMLQETGLSLEKIEAVGMAVPGSMSVEKGMLINPPNMKGWENLPIADHFEQKLQRTIFINNDANGASLAEWFFGEFRGVDNLIYLTMSTGVGGGIISGGRLVQGTSDFAGEVGHFVLDPNGPLCGCGTRGCFEAFCGGKNVADQIRQAIQDGAKTSILEHAGGDPAKIDFAVFREAVQDGDPFAVEKWGIFIDRLAQGIGTLIMILNPQAIVLGTIAIHSGDLLFDPLLNAPPKYAWPEATDVCRVRPSALGSRIGDLGALAIAIDNLRTD